MAGFSCWQTGAFDGSDFFNSVAQRRTGNNMSALQAASAGVKDMADGSLRITIEFEPRYARDAFALFGARGTQVAIAALKDGSFLAQPAPDPEAYPDLPQPRVRLGEACYWTVMRCNEFSFLAFLNSKYVFDGSTAKEAGDLVKRVCNVKSRKDLDTDPEANKTWNREIRQPYADYLKRMEAA